MKELKPIRKKDWQKTRLIDIINIKKKQFLTADNPNLLLSSGHEGPEMTEQQQRFHFKLCLFITITLCLKVICTVCFYH